MASFTGVLERVAALKLTANAAYAEERFNEALATYGEALTLLEGARDDGDASDLQAAIALHGVLLSNRSATYLGRRHEGDAAHAEQDARQCINIRPLWWKGSWRLALALCRLRRLEEAHAVLAGLVERADAGEFEPPMADAQRNAAMVKMFTWELALVESLDDVEEKMQALEIVCRMANKDWDDVTTEVWNLGEDGVGHGRYKEWHEMLAEKANADVVAALDVPDRDAAVRALSACSWEPQWAMSFSQMDAQEYAVVVTGCRSGYVFALKILEHKPTVDDFVEMLHMAILAPGGGQAKHVESHEVKEPSWPVTLLIAHRMHTAPEWGELSQRLSALIPKTLIQLESREAAEACAARHGTDPDGHNETYENPQQNC